jgi:type IV pilus assembly protein PilC
MPLFAYKVIREDGTSASDEALAADAGDFRRDLEDRGYLVLIIAEKKAGLRGGRGNARDFLIFNQEFITLVKAGLRILPLFEIIQKGTGKPGFCTVLENILQNIKDGKAMSEAMADHHLYFLALYLPIFEMGARLK